MQVRMRNNENANTLTPQIVNQSAIDADEKGLLPFIISSAQYVLCKNWKYGSELEKIKLLTSKEIAAIYTAQKENTF